jgi:hypothetical protein
MKRIGDQRYLVPCEETTKEVNLVASGLVVGFIDCKSYVKPEKNIFYRCKVTGDQCIYQIALDQRKDIESFVQKVGGRRITQLLTK